MQLSQTVTRCAAIAMLCFTAGATNAHAQRFEGVITMKLTAPRGGPRTAIARIDDNGRGAGRGEEIRTAPPAGRGRGEDAGRGRGGDDVGRGRGQFTMPSEIEY